MGCLKVICSTFLRSCFLLVWVWKLYEGILHKSWVIYKKMEQNTKSQFCLLFSHLFLNMISWSLRHAIHAKVEFIRVTVMLSSQAFYIEVVDLHYFSGFLAFFKTWPQKQCGTNSLASRLATLNFPSKKSPKWILNLQVADYRDGYGGRRGRNVWAVGRRHCGWIATKWSNAGFWSNG